METSEFGGGRRSGKTGTGVKVYRDPDDWWVGWYRGPNHHYVCLLPTVVFRWSRHRDLCNDELEAGDVHETCYLASGHEGSHESDDAMWGEEVPI